MQRTTPKEICEKNMGKNNTSYTSTGEKTHPSHLKFLISKTWGHISSGTGQGGGGSFKSTKPLGETGCCESRMAKQKPLIDRTVQLSLT